jgi:hypothetical protein
MMNRHHYFFQLCFFSVGSGECVEGLGGFLDSECSMPVDGAEGHARDGRYNRTITVTRPHHHAIM